MNFSIGSFNILDWDPAVKPGTPANNWVRYQPQVVDIIKNVALGIICLQEISQKERNRLQPDFSKMGYTYASFMPAVDPSSTESGGVVILYKKERFSRESTSQKRVNKDCINLFLKDQQNNSDKKIIHIANFLSKNKTKPNAVLKAQMEGDQSIDVNMTIINSDLKQNNKIWVEPASGVEPIEINQQASFYYSLVAIKVTYKEALQSPSFPSSREEYQQTTLEVVSKMPQPLNTQPPRSFRYKIMEHFQSNLPERLSPFKDKIIKDLNDLLTQLMKDKSKEHSFVETLQQEYGQLTHDYEGLPFTYEEIKDYIYQPLLRAISQAQQDAVLPINVEQKGRTNIKQIFYNALSKFQMKK